MDDRAPLLSLVAKPGDEDLTLDVDGVTITAVVVGDGQELLVETTGGFGRFLATNGDWFNSLPGDGEVHETELRLCLERMSEATFVDYVERLELWRDQAVPLRLCLAPGRAGTIIATRDEWLPFPSTPFPDVVE
jgi:hypothetical protein